MERGGERLTAGSWSRSLGVDSEEQWLPPLGTRGSVLPGISSPYLR